MAEVRVEVEATQQDFDEQMAAQIEQHDEWFGIHKPFKEARIYKHHGLWYCHIYGSDDSLEFEAGNESFEDLLNIFSKYLTSYVERHGDVYCSIGGDFNYLEKQSN